MVKHNTPMNLYNYTIINNGTNHTHQETQQELKNLIKLMKQNQTHYYKNNNKTNIQQWTNNQQQITGKLNTLGRKLNIQPHTNPQWQPYNFTEMFNTNILMKTAKQIQDQTLQNFIKNNQKDKNNIKKLTKKYKQEYPYIKTPTPEYLKQIIHQTLNKKNTNKTPNPDGILPFWATDTHYCKNTYNKQTHQIYFTIKLFKKEKPITLTFDLPKTKRFTINNNDTITRPTVGLDKKGRIRFGFTIKRKYNSPTIKNNVIGVDLGRKTPFTATFMNNAEISVPIVPSREINIISKKIDSLGNLLKCLYDKRVVCENNGRVDKALVLKEEYSRVRGKVSRLKNERCLRVASLLVGIAGDCGAGLVLENLSWVPDSKWEQAAQTAAIQNRAVSKEVSVTKISPKNTSKECSKCGSLRTHYNKRVLVCKDCSKKLDRDISASRIIALRRLRNILNENKDYHPVLNKVFIGTNASIVPSIPGTNQYYTYNKFNNYYNNTE